MDNSVLSEEEIYRKVAKIPMWILKGNLLTRELVAPNFSAALGIVFSIGVVAESLNHHPDILIYGWNKIRVETTTCDLGGLTELDFVLAQKIDELNF